MNVKNFRAPAVPLITQDPFFSVWSDADKLTDDNTRHWDCVRKFMIGLVVVDNVIYQFMGKLGAIDDERRITPYETLPQTGVEIRPMTTIYTFENKLLKMKVRFTSPLLLNDLMILSRPVGYIDYEIEFKDGKEHETYVQFAFSGEFCVNENTQSVKVDITPLSICFTSGTENMLKRSGDDHRIEWGSFHVVAPEYVLERMSLRSLWVKLKIAHSKALNPYNILICQGPNHETSGKKEYALGEEIPVYPEYPVIMARKDFPNASGKITDGIALAYDDVKSIQYFGENIDCYYKKDGDSFSQMLFKALQEHDEVLEKVKKFEDKLLREAKKISPKYADIISLSYRQAIAGHKLTFHDGEIQFFSKENYSNGSIATVDVTYPSIPLFLIYAPELVEGMLNPIFKMIEKGLWIYEFAPHDAGTYPLANGQTYGYCFRHRDRRPNPYDSQMPVEECGNMLLVVAAICYAEKKFDYFKKHEKLLKQWADYLVNIGYDPDNQLCTDDFAGHLAHNCNLSAKAICALEAYSMMLRDTGDKKAAEQYDKIARDFVKKWEKAAFDGKWYRLAFDQKGTWSLKYNMVWDKLLGMNLFSKKVYDAELQCYKSHMDTYGVPMDSRGSSTKTDWEMWSTVLFDDKEYTDMIVDRMWKFLCETVDRVPFADLIYTDKPWLRGFIARTVQGGVFINLLKF